MTGTPAERAALLSARIHREINAGRAVVGHPDFDLPPTMPPLGWLSQCYEAWLLFGWRGESVSAYEASPAYRLGAELRAIVLGNREGRR